MRKVISFFLFLFLMINVRAYSNGNIVFGDRNRLIGSSNEIFGSSNQIRGDNNVHIGFDSIIEGS